jgi:catechol 2,3-dioxygenase-like lactoylglutathione lyase family enzyme
MGMSTGNPKTPAASWIESVSAITLATHDMPRAVRFYSALGFSIRHGGALAAFTSFRAGEGYLNLIAAGADQRWSWWGRVIFYVADVDALYRHAVAQGLQPQFTPRDAQWGERYFHVTDPDGHELSFAKLLGRDTQEHRITG